MFTGWNKFYLLLSVTILLSHAAWAKDLNARVIRVLDGDSLIVRTASGNELELRLAGIDAPEYDQPYGAKARRYLNKQVRSKTLSFTISGVDRYNRLLACPVVSDRDLCEQMVLEGFAWVYRSKTDEAKLIAAEARAQAQQSGLWALPETQRQAPWKWRQRKPLAKGTQSASDPACKIKGNISSSGERIFHLPNQRDYHKVRISERKGERWFCDAPAALAAGWRQAKR